MERFSTATVRDLDVARRQIGREPRGMIGVSKRCRFGCPQVIVTEPLLYTSSSPVPELFPTTYWLSCPHLCRAVGTLESRKLIGAIRSRVAEDPVFRERLASRHRQYARERVSLVDSDQLTHLKANHPNVYRRLVKLGIGGVGHSAGVKCLHLHFADYLSGGDNPIGEEVLRFLEDDGIPLECETGICCPCADTAAVINVGSNSVKLLVARLTQDSPNTCCLSEIVRRVIVTRLAEDMAKSADTGVPERRLKPEAVRRTARAVASLVDEARKHSPTVLTIFGTAAVRQSDNPDELVRAICSLTGLKLAVISEREEAGLSFAAASNVLDDPFNQDFALTVDIGGASTEIAIGRNRTMLEYTSVAVGALTALQLAGVDFDDAGRLTPGGLEQLMEKTRTLLRDSGQGLLFKRRAFAAAGGSVTVLAALLLRLDEYQFDAVHGRRIDYNSAVAMLKELCSRSRQERLKMPGMLSEERVDSVIGGTAILVSLMEIAEADHVIVSEYGVLEGMACLVLLGRFPA